MKFLFLYVPLLLLVFTVQTVHAQDVLVLHDGDEIEAKIITVSKKEVEYKEFDNQKGPSFTIEKKKIYLIKYEDGKKEFFNEKNMPSSKKLTIGLGIGFGRGKTYEGDESSRSISSFINLYYNITNRWSVGIEYQTLAGMNLDYPLTQTSLKGKYFLGTDKIRPHVGLGIGMYNIEYTDYKSMIGFSPEVGMNFSFFQIAANYHFLPSKEFTEIEEFNNTTNITKFSPSVFEVKFTANINFIK
ncbi:hypothetical protein [Flammeovirga sp. EKP202]|uniref:hypothetical protein n=1 Tax=Flammeovirga sp. EKP202 TaxID=2770592 RepID=UPI00165EE827|nr:hypothetical protein [Flammeovirga sp. EKP202]MBD0404793.1 hypothetical protein [Flammeovirga sp. EKP202]